MLTETSLTERQALHNLTYAKSEIVKHIKAEKRMKGTKGWERAENEEAWVPGYKVYATQNRQGLEMGCTAIAL